ncbi:penicillin-binding transpeptidase domain-containing protein [Lacrimispora aerotolerans]|uniref:penicillin-binding transpeptidase domain-containing protein n=1 Tax=Lacrimispora aerotolerans TaxID=36832 RepID=UPI00047AA6F1|nr:penicillin-binding transpeptidase domain-containing protein [Lacrimispora aerotolerans]
MNRARNRILFRIIVTVLILLAGLTGAFLFFQIQKKLAERKKPDVLFSEYMDSVKGADYKAMYEMLTDQSRINISEEDFTARNKNIYEGLEVSDIKTEITNVEYNDKKAVLSYEMEYKTAAGTISFKNKAEYERDRKKGYQLIWSDSLIFPELLRGDKVRISVDKAIRGTIYDRNGNVLAGKGTASSIGLVPGKMSEDPSGDMETLSGLLGIPADSIKKKLAAKWVKEDSFVPLKTLKKVDEFNLVSSQPREDNVKNKELQDKLLAIPGVLISDTPVRFYPLMESGAHLVGYVQNVTAEDIKEHPDEDYLTDSVIGRSGMEALYEKDLKGINGRTVSIVDGNGTEKKILAAKSRMDGKDITLTIDSELQASIYNTFSEDKSTTVAMNPVTGEILALVSTPSFDDNDFILGMSNDTWNALNTDERKPMFNRFRQKFAPGSSLKPITAVIGLNTGAIDPNEDYISSGLKWRKDESWGNYYVTTLHDSSPLNLENALIYSNNIYFAKAALKIGAKDFMAGLDKLGFKEDLPFEITVAKSQYSNGDTIDSEVQLADSGYGQGQILMNPVHLASLYTMFTNKGNVIKPYLLYKKEPASEIWLKDATTPEIAETVASDLVKVVSSEHGTGHAINRSDIQLAGKTGTAEIKASKSDTTGTELGWFSVFTTDQAVEKPILLVSMVEDVKNRGGSGYVVRKDKVVLDAYFTKKQ